MYIACRRGGGGPPRGALAGVVKVLGERLAPPPNHLYVTWIMKKIADFFTIS